MRSLSLLAAPLLLPLAACAAAPPPAPAAPAPCPTIAPTPPAPPTPPAAAAAAAPATPPPPPPKRDPPREFTDATDAARAAILASDWKTADARIAAAETVAKDEPHLLFLATYYRAARFVYAGDLERAAAAFVAVIPTLAKHPESPDEFWSHNSMMMIREAQGDPAAALAEDDQATIAAARGTWETPEDRENLAYTKDRWHRAYLTRMLAEMRPAKSSAREGLLQYAQSALDDYAARAHKLGGYDDSIAILEAYFAALDGRKDAARAAAKRVDPAKDDDIEDLYLVVIGLEAGGDHAGAEEVRKIMRKPGGVHIGRAVMLRWLDLDAKHGKGFTPWHPNGPNGK